MKAKLKKRTRPIKGTMQVTPVALELDAAVERVIAVATEEAQKHGLQVMVVVRSPIGQWRAKWGTMSVDDACNLTFRLLTAIQRMLP